MPSISFGGINTGLPPNLVDQLIQAEAIPIKNLENRKGNIQAKMDLTTKLEELLRGIEKNLRELAGTKGFRDMKLNSSDPSIISGVVDPAVAGNGDVSIEVIELAEKASAITNGFPDKDRTEVGVGYIEFETADGPKEVYIDGGNNTLQGVAEAINRAGIGIKASIINDRADDDAPFKLVVSGSGVGDDNMIEYPTIYFLDGDQDFYFDEEREAKNGVVKIDGFETEISENQLRDIIPGVTIDLLQAEPGKKVRVEVKEDLEVVSGKIDEFVKSMNEVLQFIQTQSRLDANTDTSKTLGGDSLIRTVARRMRSLIQNSQLGVKGDIKRLNQLGIEFNRSGTLDFNQERFNNALSRGPEQVEAFFAGDGFVTGFIPTLRNTVNTLLNPSFGPITNRKNGFRQRIDRIDDQIERKQNQLTKRELTLKRKFARLEETMSKIKSQGGQVAALGGGGGGLGVNLAGASAG